MKTHARLHPASSPAGSDFPVRALEATAFTIPTATDRESDGTIEWSKTTLILVQAHAGGKVGIGYSYADKSAVGLIREVLLPHVVSPGAPKDALDIPAIWQQMIRAVRNIGRPGVASMAIAAVDNALWDLKAKLLNVSLARLLGQAREEIEIYGSGGFTSYSIPELQEQLGGWVEQGITAVKMKVGTHPHQDPERVRAAREAIGRDARLYVDANGAYDRKQALALALEFSDLGVSWFEEPVSSDDLPGLRLIRGRAPAGMDIAAGEYGFDTPYFKRMLAAGAVDILQIDGTRCMGVSGFLEAAALGAAWNLPISAHTAPSLHAHLCCSVHAAKNLEYFFDHVRIENMLFDGTLEPIHGKLRPDPSRPGIGLEFRKRDADRFAA